MFRFLPLVLLVACGEPKDEEETGFVDDGKSHLFIVSPDDGATVSGCFTIQVQVYNFELINPVSEGENIEGHGHWHAIFGPRYFDCEEATCDIAFTDDLATDTTVIAQLVGNDHNPVEDDAGEKIEDVRTYAYNGEPCPDPV